MLRKRFPHKLRDSENSPRRLPRSGPRGASPCRRTGSSRPIGLLPRKGQEGRRRARMSRRSSTNAKAPQSAYSQSIGQSPKLQSDVLYTKPRERIFGRPLIQRFRGPSCVVFPTHWAPPNSAACGSSTRNDGRHPKASTWPAESHVSGSLYRDHRSSCMPSTSCEKPSGRLSRDPATPN